MGWQKFPCFIRVRPWLIRLFPQSPRLRPAAHFSNSRPALCRGHLPERSVYGLKLVTAPPIGEPWHNFLLAYRNKLYDKRVVRMPDHKAWDQLEIPKNITVGQLRGALLHFSFRDFAHFVDKMNRTSSRRAQFGNPKSIVTIRLRVLFAMPFYFFKAYVVKGRWRAGLYGFSLARISAYSRWLRDAKMYESHCRNAAKKKSNDANPL